MIGHDYQSEENVDLYTRYTHISNLIRFKLFQRSQWKQKEMFITRYRKNLWTKNRLVYFFRSSNTYPDSILGHKNIFTQFCDVMKQTESEVGSDMLLVSNYF